MWQRGEGMQVKTRTGEEAVSWQAAMSAEGPEGGGGGRTGFKRQDPRWGEQDVLRCEVRARESSGRSEVGSMWEAHVASGSRAIVSPHVLSPPESPVHC